MTQTKDQIRQMAQQIWQSSFKFSSIQQMLEAISQERESVIRDYKDQARKHAREVALSNPTAKIDSRWIRTVYASGPSLIKMTAYNEDRHGDPIWVKHITKKEIIRCIEDLLESAEDDSRILQGFTIAVDAQLYYYDEPNDRLQGIPPEPTGEYYTLDLVEYKPDPAITWGDIFSILTK